MKSKLFRQNEAFKEDSFKLEPMKRDVAAALSIGADKLPAFMKAVGEILNTGVSEHERIAQSALPGLGLEHSVFDHASNVAGWLASELLPDGPASGDTAEAIVEDMISLKLIAADEKSRGLGFVRAVQGLVAAQARSDVEKDKAWRMHAPKVVGVDTALFFRNVFRKGPAGGDASKKPGSR